MSEDDFEFKMDPDEDESGPLVESEHATDPEGKQFHLSLMVKDGEHGLEIHQIADLLIQYAKGLQDGSIPLFDPDEEMHH